MRVLVTRGGELAAPGPTCGDHSEQAANTCNCGGWVSLDDGRRLDEVLVADRPDITTKEQLTAACAAYMHADAIEADEELEADDIADIAECAPALADFITDIADGFPVGTPLWTVYDHRNDEWHFVLDERPELRRRAREEPPRFTF